MTTTTNYGWTKPTVGGDSNAWGGELNTDLDGIDTAVFAVSGVANAALPKAGGTLTGTITLAAGTTVVAPMKFQAGALLTAPVAHAHEWDGTYLYATQASGPTRKQIAYADGTGASGSWGISVTGSAASCTGNAANITGTYAGTISASQVNTGLGYTAGYLNIPQNSKSSGYTLIASDVGKHISITTGGVTIPTAIFSAGDAITIYNNSASSQTITQGASTTVYNAADGTTGNRTLGGRGLATVLCVAANTFVISGAGLT